MPPTDKRPQPKRRTPDWDAIKRWFETDPRPLYRCVDQHGSTVVTIEKRAREQAWKRCPDAEAYQPEKGTRAKVTAEMIDPAAGEAGLPPLTPYQRAFVDEFLVDKKAGAAIMRAGYVPPADREDWRDLADNAGANMMATPAVRAWINWRQGQIARRCEFDAERVLRELGAIAFLDPRRLIKVGPSGEAQLMAVAEMDEWDARAIKEIKVDQAGIVTLKFYDKTQALTKLGQRLELFKFVHQHETKKDPNATGKPFAERFRRGAGEVRGNGHDPAKVGPARPGGGPALSTNGSGQKLH